MFNLFGKPKEEITAVFDIGNGSVGGALVKVSSSHPPIILYTHRVPILFTAHVGAKRLQSQMVKLLRDVSEHIAKDGLSHTHFNYFGPNLKDVHCVFATPWFVSETKNLKNTFESQTVISQKYLDDLVLKEEENFRDSLRQNPSTKAFAESITLIEKKIMDVKLNGYSVLNPIGKQAREIELMFFSSYVPSEIKDSVESVLHRSFNFRKVNYHSFALASCVATNDIFPEPSDFISLDITGEVTDISIVKNGVLLETASFPFGRGTVLRSIAKELSLDSDVTHTFFTMFYKKTLEKKFADKISDAINKITDQWKDKFQEVMQDVIKRNSIPNMAYITVDTDSASFFVNALSGEMKMELGIQGNKFAVSVLDENSLSGHYHVAPKVLDDPFLGLEAVYLSKFFSKKSV